MQATSFIWGAIGIIVGASCSNPEDAIQRVSDADRPPLQRIEGGRFSYSERGKIMHVLQAGILERTEAGTAENPADIVQVRSGFDLYIGGDESASEAHMQAENGTLDEKHLRLVARDHVRLVNLEGDLLETEYLVWAEDSNRVWTNRPVTITTKSGVIHGKGLESDGRFETYTILEPTGEITLEGMDLPSN